MMTASSPMSGQDQCRSRMAPMQMHSCDRFDDGRNARQRTCQGSVALPVRVASGPAATGPLRQLVATVVSQAAVVIHVIEAPVGGTSVGPVVAAGSHPIAVPVDRNRGDPPRRCIPPAEMEVHEPRTPITVTGAMDSAVVEAGHPARTAIDEPGCASRGANPAAAVADRSARCPSRRTNASPAAARRASRCSSGAPGRAPGAAGCPAWATARTAASAPARPSRAATILYLLDEAVFAGRLHAAYGRCRQVGGVGRKSKPEEAGDRTGRGNQFHGI